MIRYLCIDDEGSDVINPIMSNLKDTSNEDLDIIHKRPQGFNVQIEEIQDRMNQQVYDGLILDLRLDMFKNPEGEKANYRAFTLAQEIRSRVTEGKLFDFPIVLCAMHARMRKSYTTDDTSHNLYDAVYEKETIPDNASEIATELISLVKGYKTIKKQIESGRPPFYKIICPDGVADNTLNSSILGIFEKKRPLHEYARFILNELLRVPGPLIDETTLAARLGIDIEQSSGWKKLRDLLPRKTAYRGAFSDGWQRWWSIYIEEWWRKLKFNPGPLSRVPANDRVDCIKKATKIKNIVKADPIEQGYSNRFWTICLGYHKPLDPVDGFLLEEAGERRPWQDKAYISIKAALERKDGLKINRLEQDRLREIKRAKK
ncbi:MAG: hypothetical protein WC769_06925 [Thermodesulfovibrionales bacterium]|jgi:hypothetical protein